MRCFRCKDGETRGSSLLCPECRRQLACAAITLEEEQRRRALTPAQRRYEDAFGREAAERQIAAAAEFLPCCGEHRDDGHHEACSKRPAEPELSVAPGQESLL